MQGPATCLCKSTHHDCVEHWPLLPCSQLSALETLDRCSHPSTTSHSDSRTSTKIPYGSILCAALRHSTWYLVWQHILSDPRNHSIATSSSSSASLLLLVMKVVMLVTMLLNRCWKESELPHCISCPHPRSKIKKVGRPSSKASITGNKLINMRCGCNYGMISMIFGRICSSMIVFVMWPWPGVIFVITIYSFSKTSSKLRCLF